MKKAYDRCIDQSYWTLTNENSRKIEEKHTHTHIDREMMSVMYRSFVDRWQHRTIRKGERRKISANEEGRRRRRGGDCLMDWFDDEWCVESFLCLIVSQHIISRMMIFQWEPTSTADTDRLAACSFEMLMKINELDLSHTRHSPINNEEKRIDHHQRTEKKTNDRFNDEKRQRRHSTKDHHQQHHQHQHAHRSFCLLMNEKRSACVSRVRTRRMDN